MMLKLNLLLLSILLTSCNTLIEVTQPGESTLGYGKTVNSEGETVYHRERAKYPDYGGTSLTDHRHSLTDDPYHTPPLAPTTSGSGETPLTSQTRFTDSETAEHSNQITESDHSINPPATNPKSDGFSLYTDLSATPGHTHLGFHIGFDLETFFQPRLGGSLFYSKEPYFGFDASARLLIPIPIVQPFVGMGLYFGDTKSCHTLWNPDSHQYDEICDKKFLGAAYGEAGLRYRFVSLFMRNYRINRADLDIPTHRFYGISLELSGK